MQLGTNIVLQEATNTRLNPRLGVFRGLLQFLVALALVAIVHGATNAVLVDGNPDDKEESGNSTTDKGNESVDELLLDASIASTGISKRDDPTERVEASTSQAVEENGGNENGATTDEAAPEVLLAEFLGTIAVENLHFLREKSFLAKVGERERVYRNGHHEGSNALNRTSLIVSHLVKKKKRIVLFLFLKKRKQT